MIDRLNKDQLDGILNALPIELIYVDENDCLQYCNKAERQEQMNQGKILGRDIRNCHKPESLPQFWIDGLGVKLLNRFLAVRDQSGKYLGCIEYLLDFSALEALAEAKKDSHRFLPSRGDSSKPEEVR
jgi:DUF438 domain-containing protein